MTHIVVEATGRALAGPVARTLLENEEMNSWVQFCRVVTVVDALHGLSRLEEAESEAQEQVAMVQGSNKCPSSSVDTTTGGRDFSEQS